MSPPQNEISKASDFLYFDPKVSKNSKAPRSHKVAFQEAIVFVVGGGNYLEYQNLQELANVGLVWFHFILLTFLFIKQQNNSKRKITYGSTEILSPQQFLDQLATLGKDSSLA